MLDIQSVGNYKMIPGERFSYDSGERTIHYVPEAIDTKSGKLAFLHEISHANLGHFSYRYDIELLTMEIEAWEETKRLAEEHKVSIDNEYINDCLSSYDQWITKRATCPKCKTFGLQKSTVLFSCFVCDAKWKVNKRKDREVRRVLIEDF